MNSSDVVRRIFRHIISDELALGFNWAGRGSKSPFSTLKITTVIKGNCRANSSLSCPPCVLSTTSNTGLTIPPAISFPRSNDTLLTGNSSTTPIRTQPDTIPVSKYTQCNGTAVVPIPIPRSSTCEPTAVVSDHGNTLESIRDCAARVPHKVVSSKCPLGLTNTICLGFGVGGGFCLYLRAGQSAMKCPTR
ncbi:hypothetical protein DPEC_G00187800 [Dallia pectoralis]|uniref:Uncharacterized protein n=1 Tax=Dallia pectoralis TaxID=75939 RepID=A0ACC2GBJ9_DALPE|nr:hypothetical protein DPEC_G00187800 [Dallia pectoralis]